MNILFLTRLYWPHVGGVERHIEEVSKRLGKIGYKITIVTTKHEKNLKTVEKRGLAKIIRFNQPKIKYLGLIYTWLWFLKNINLIYKSDIVHCHDVFIWYLPFRFLFSQKLVFTTFHGRWGKYPVQKKDILQKRIGAKLSRKIMCIGDYIPKYYGIKSDIISYGAANIVKGKFKKDNNLIIYVGRLDKDIALQTIFKVFDKIVGKRFEFCGDGELVNECMHYGKVHGFCDPKPFYKRAKYCFASGYLTIIEALLNKCVVFTAYSHELHKDYYKMSPFSELIICSNKPDELLKKINLLLKNENKTKRIINKGYNWAKGQTWENLVKKYEELWEVRKI